MIRFDYYFKNVDRSKSLIEFAKKKISSEIEKYVSDTSRVFLVFSSQNHMQTVKCHVGSGHRVETCVQVKSENAFEAIDQIASKLQAVFSQRKNRKLWNQKSRAKRPLIEAEDIGVEI
jgi:ribosome-associated translation inhibitor RaiA